MDYHSLKQFIIDEGKSGETDAAVTAWLNESVTGYQDIQTSDIREYIVYSSEPEIMAKMANKAAGGALITEATQAKAISGWMILNPESRLESIETSHATKRGYFETKLDELVTAGLLGTVTEPTMNAHRNAIRFMMEKTMTRGEAEGFGLVKRGDVEYARAL